MCIFSSPSVPAPPLPPPAPAPMPEQTVENNADMKLAAENERRRAALTMGRGSTIKTSSQGLLGQAQTSSKTLLGQ